MTTHRLQLDFTERAHKDLQEIRELAGTKTSAETIANALGLYRYFLSETINRRKFLIRDASGHLERLNISFNPGGPSFLTRVKLALRRLFRL